MVATDTIVFRNPASENGRPCAGWSDLKRKTE